jgi:hypothetical protein
MNGAVTAICLFFLFSCSFPDSAGNKRLQVKERFQPISVEVSVRAVLVKLKASEEKGFQTYDIHIITDENMEVRIPEDRDHRTGWGAMAAGSDMPSVHLSFLRLDGRVTDTSSESVIITCTGRVNDTPFTIKEEFKLSSPHLSVHLLPYNEVYEGVNWIVLLQMSIGSYMKAWR